MDTLVSLPSMNRPCQFDDMCPYGSYCNANHICQADCKSDSECQGDGGDLTCNCLGHCVEPVVPSPAPATHLPQLGVDQPNILISAVVGTPPSNPDWDGQPVRSIDVTATTDFITDGQISPEVLVTPGPNVQAQCAGQDMSSAPCKFKLGNYAKEGDVYRAHGQLQIQPTPTVDPTPPATVWEVRIGSEEATSTPQIVRVHYSARAVPDPLPDNWMDVQSLPTTFQAKGNFHIMTSTGSQFDIPVTARGDDNFGLVLNDPTRFLSPSGKFALQPQGIGTGDEGEDWVSFTPSSQVNRAQGTDAILITLEGFQQNLTTGQVYAQMILNFKIDRGEQSPDVSSNLYANVTLFPAAAGETLTCANDSQCATGEKCDLGFCTSGRLSNPNGFTGIGGIGATTWAPYIDNEPAFDRSFCYTPDTNALPDHNNLDFLTTSIAPMSGDLLCDAYHIVDSLGNYDGLIPPFPPETVPLLVHKDLEDLGLRQKLSAADLLSACLSELNRRDPRPQATPTSRGYPSDVVKFAAECINVGRFMSELWKFQELYFANPTPSDGKVGAGPAMYLHLLQQWVEVHGFMAREALEETRLNQVVGDEAAGPKPSLVTLLDEMETGGALAISRLVLDQNTFSFSPDYRLSVTRGRDCQMPQCDTIGHDPCSCDDPFEECVSNKCQPVALSQAPQQEQSLGIAPVLLEEMSGHLMLVEELINQVAGARYGNNATADSVVAALDRYGIALRLSMQMEAYATTIHDTYASSCTECDQASMEARWQSAVNEFQTIRDRLVKQAKVLGAGLNPLGIPEDDIPLFFGDPTGTNSRYFASSDYVLNGWAAPAVATAQTDLDAARTAWINEQNAAVQDQLLQSAQDQRVDDLKAKYGQVVLDNCGELTASDGTPLQSAAVLDVYGKNPAALQTCFVKPECISKDPDNPMALKSLIDQTINDRFSQVHDPIQGYEDTDSNQAVWNWMCKRDYIAADCHYQYSPTYACVPSDISQATRAAAKRSKVLTQSQQFWHSEPAPGGGGGCAVGVSTEFPLYRTAQVVKLADGMYFQSYCPDPPGVPGDYTCSTMHVAQPKPIPIAALYRKVSNRDFAFDDPNINPNSNIVISTDDQYGFFDIESDEFAYEEATEYCADLQYCIFAANTRPKAAHMFRDAPLPHPADLPASCYRGQMGVAWNEVKNALLGVKDAQQTLFTKTANLGDTFKLCTTIDMQVAQLTGLLDNLEAMKDAYYGLATFSTMYTASIGPYSGAGLFSTATSIFSNFISTEQANYDTLSAEFSLDLKSQECWNTWREQRRELREAMTKIQTAEGLTKVQQVILQNDRDKNDQSIKEGLAVVAREKNRPVGGYAHTFWIDEKVERFKRDLEWARRLTFLAMRAIEYEFQQSLPFRTDILNAKNPDDLDKVLLALKQEQASRTINRRRPEDAAIVLSIRDDVLHVTDRSDAAAGERAWTPAQRLESRLWSDDFAIRDRNGNWMGQGVPFTLGPDGVLDTRCGERMWRVTATVQGDGLSPTQPGVPLLLMKRNKFESQYCAGKGSGRQFQEGIVHTSAMLFQPNDMVDLSDSSEFTAAMIYPWFNIPRSQFFKTSYQDGSSEELAGRGLYGDYVLLFPKEVLDAGFPLDHVEDVLLRIDYLSVDNLSQ
jgi:hypothetical protein